MNRVTAVGVPVEVRLRESRNGVLYANFSLTYRTGDRYARLPAVAFGVLAERAAVLEGQPAVLGGYLQEYATEEGHRRMQVVAQELFGADLPTFTAPMGHPAVDGYARAELSGLVALDPKPLVGAVGLRLAVRYPMGTRQGETFALVVVPGGRPEAFSRGMRLFAEGALLARKGRPEVVDLLAGRVVPARVAAEAAAV